MDEHKQKLINYLKSHHVMSLSTIGTDGFPWTTTVYYAMDNDLNFYFMSEPESQHCLNILKQKKVSFSVADTDQKLRDKKIGITVQGISQRTKGFLSSTKAALLWSQANVEIDDMFYPQNLIFRAIHARPYVIKPTVIKFMNEELYGMLGSKLFYF